jgi:hypothetical protein
MNIVNNKTLLSAELDNNQALFFSQFFGTLALQWVQGSQRRFQFFCLKDYLQVRGQLSMVGYGWIVSLWATTATLGTRPPSDI